MKELILQDAENKNFSIYTYAEEGRFEVFSNDHKYSIDVYFEYELNNISISGDGWITPEEVEYDIVLDCVDYVFFNDNGDEFRANFTKTELGILEYRLLKEFEEVVLTEELYND